ncbi:MAG TPA: hypothetical protein DEB09_01640 [Candidatus Magasanikbacteria bacterium]|nr:hypothetical protein [Candidatus Magasanikbacteria bacterium]
MLKIQSFIKKQTYLFFLLVNLFLLYFNLTSWHYTYLGWFLFLSYLIIVGQWWQDSLKRVFSLKKKTWLTSVFSWFVVFSLLSLVSSIFVMVYKLDILFIFALYLTVAIVSLLQAWYFERKKANNRENLEAETDKDFILFTGHFLWILAYFVLCLVGFYLLYSSESTSVLNLPWQTINQYYLLVFFILTILSGIFLFSKYKTKVILLIFLLQSILLHLYLPMSHQMPWGGDVWRHIAVEEQLLSGDSVLPVLVGPEANWIEVSKVDLPEVFFNPQKYSYGAMWGSSVVLAQTLQTNLITVNKWLMPILWSIVFPFIMFKLGWILFGTRRRGLLLAWLSFLPFSLQALGSLTLPVSFGLLFFLFTLMLWLQYLRDGNKYQKYLVIFFSILMLWSYSLYFILIWLVIILSLITYHLSNNIGNPYNLFRRILLGIVALVSVFIIPIIEIINKVSFIPDQIPWWQNFKQLIGQFSGWFYASMIRPHDILSGNFLFNHTPDLAFVSSIFNTWRWWLILAMVIVWCLIMFGVFEMSKIKDQRSKIINLLFYTVLGGYIIGWFVLEGDKLFTRRLDGVLAVLILILLIKGLMYITYHLSLITCNINKNNILSKIGVLLFIVSISWFTTFTYASGPDIRVVSVDEYGVAEYIMSNISSVDSLVDGKDQKIKRSKDQLFSDDLLIFRSSDLKPCVLADTWILLPLEALSSGGIVGGGFPIDYQFGQKERVELLDKFTVNPDVSSLITMKDLTQADKCWFVQKSELFVGSNLDKVNQIFKSEPELVGGMFVWQEGIDFGQSNVGLKKDKK